ncbi:MAG: hybrid sensor histidine kinase/response regulator [Magnetococcales bacterium]|nr:hybrid sensor histidine kinase/response regulator [Magnetococcales bacterium]
MNEQELLKKLREAFRQESRERLATIGTALVELEKVQDGTQRQGLLEAIYRDAHSLKGAARAVNLKEIETVCQALESLFSALKGETLIASAGLFDAIHKAIHFMEAILVGDLNQPMAPVSKRELAMLVGELEACPGSATAGRGGPVAAAPVVRPQDARVLPVQTVIEPTPAPAQRAVQQEDPPAMAATPPAAPPVTPPVAPPVTPPVASPAVVVTESVRVAAERLDQLLIKAEEMIALKLVSQQHLLNLRQTCQIFGLWRKKWSEAESSWRFLRKTCLVDQVGNANKELGTALETTNQFLLWNQEQVQTLQKDIQTLARAMDHSNRAVNRMVDDLLETAKQVIMVESSILLDPLPRMVREIAREQNKEVALLLAGGEVEVDRRILEEMRDPMLHLLRNALDHGLEKPDDRVRAGKNRQGTVHVTVAQTEGNKIELLVSDDGAGLDLAKLKEIALKKGLLTPEQAFSLADRDATELIFHSGMTTAPIITNLSGRGLGMAIVRERVEKMGGTLAVENRPGQGLTFRITLPVSLATFRGVIVQCARHVFVIPSLHVLGLLRVAGSEIRSVENRATFLYKGHPVSLVELAHVLGIAGEPPEPEENTKILVAVLGMGHQQIGFRIHAVLKEQEVLVKGLGKQLQKVKNFAGATILGSGRVVPILNVQELLESAIQNVGSVPVEGAGVQEETKRKSILVVEDSITSRMLLKNILESAGHTVQTAVDGLDGLTALKTSIVDLVISDVEMPRMNGFELTARIRADPVLAPLPVILVTSLSSRADRERGIEVGASAYIVKGDFDQNHLLGVIGRLV